MRATGVQGKGAIKHLSAAGWHVQALVTDAASDRAIALKTLGGNITLFQGNWTEPSSIKKAIQGCQAVFLNQMPSFTDDSEVQEAKVVLDLARIAGVQQVVFSSTLSLNDPKVREKLSHSAVAPAVLNKGDVEDLVRRSGLTWTLLRPGFFMTNLIPPLVYWMYPEFKERKFVNSYGPDCVFTLVDPDDIGAFISAAFDDPSKYGGRTVTVVGESVRIDNILEQLENVSGLPIAVVYRTAEETERLEDDLFIAGQLVSRGLDKFVDSREVESWGVPLTTFKQFLKKHTTELRP